MNKEQLVRRAIEFKFPERVPLLLFNRDQSMGDILIYNMSISEGNKSEWGYIWEILDDGTMGQPRDEVLPALDAVGTYKTPGINEKIRLRNLDQFKKKGDGHYLLASLGITGFSNYTFLRGFENAMVDFALNTTPACQLLDQIIEFENSVIRLAAHNGFHGVYFGDDWGTQTKLLISPQMWRDIFKRRYQKQFELAKRLGLHVWFHSCGNISAIVSDLYEIGVSVLNISQPNATDISKIGKDMAGKQCFMIPISYQTVSITGTSTDIEREAQFLYGCLASDKGGIIGYVEDYKCMGMSESNYQSCIKAFRGL